MWFHGKMKLKNYFGHNFDSDSTNTLWFSSLTSMMSLLGLVFLINWKTMDDINDIYIGMFSISMVCSWKLHGMAILLYNNLLMFSLKLGYSYVWVCTRYYTVKCFSIGNLRSKAFCQKFYQRLWHIFKSYKMAGLYMNCWDNIFSWILNFTKNFVKMISPNCPEI